MKSLVSLFQQPLRSMAFQPWLFAVCAMTLSVVCGTLAAQAANDGFVTVLVPFMSLLAVAIALLTLGNWRLGLVFFFFWIIIEDFARKFLGNNMVVYFGKDVLVGVAYLSFLLQARRREELVFRPPFMVPLVTFGVLALLQTFNYNSPSLWYGAVGLKLYFYYVPLMFLGYALFQSERQLQQFFMVTLIVAAVVSALGIAQAIVGHDFLNPKDLAPELILGRLFRDSPLTGFTSVRPAAIFVSAARFAGYLFVIYVIAIGIVFYSFIQRRHLLISSTMLCIITVGIALSNSRGAVVYSVIALAVCMLNFWWSATVSVRSGIAALGGIRRAITPIIIGLGAMIIMFPEAVFARWSYVSETFSPWSPASELQWRVVDYSWGNFLWVFSYPSWAVGYGTGIQSLGSQYVVRLLGAPPSAVGTESGWGTLILEMGILGPFAWYAWAMALVWSQWHVVRKLRGTALQPLGFSIFWFTFFTIVIGAYATLNSYQEFITNAYLWLFVGILFRLPDFIENQQSLPAPEENSTYVVVP